LEPFFPANLLASTEETKPNTTKANIHLKHKKYINVKTKARFWLPRMTSGLEMQHALFYGLSVNQATC